MEGTPRGAKVEAQAWTRRDGLTLTALIVVYLLACAAAIWSTGPTVDEPNHLTRGIAFWQTGDSRLSFAHPPLANLVAALPAAMGMAGELPRADGLQGWSTAYTSLVSLQIAQPDYPAFRRALYLGRGVQALWGLGTVLVLYVFVRRHFAWGAAAIAGALLVTNPTFIAHNSLVTTDGPATFVLLAAVVTGFEHGRRPGWPPALAWVAVVALAPIVKYSGLFAAAVSLLAFGAGRLAHMGGERDWPRWLLACTGRGLLSGAVIFGSIQAAYLGQYSFKSAAELREAPDPGHEISFAAGGHLAAQDSRLQALPDEFRVPVPAPYVSGLVLIRAQGRQAVENWFAGEHSDRGHPAYLPTVLFSKTPLALWVLLGLALSNWLRPEARASLGREQRWMLALVALVTLAYGTLAFRSNAQLGVRYVLPLVPLLVVLAASGLRPESSALTQLKGAPKDRAGAVLALVFASSALALLGAGGRNLGWFNLAVGGRGGGHELSILGEDWGQDVERLADEVKARNLPGVNFEPYTDHGLLELDHHGVRLNRIDCHTDIPRVPTWAALHRAKSRRADADCYPWRSRAVQRIVINDHIELYELSP